LAIQGIQEFLDYPSIERDKGEGEEAAKNFFLLKILFFTIKFFSHEELFLLSNGFF